MTFHDLLQQALNQSFGASLLAFRPELILCAAIVLILLARMLLPQWKASSFYVALFAAAGGLYLVIDGFKGVADGSPAQLFTGMLVSDGFSMALRGLLLWFLVLFYLFTRISGVPDAEDAAEFYLLTLGAVLGMCLMVSANNALVVLLGVEMASVPSYVLAGILRQRRKSSEAALKYAVFGAASAAVMLYGISLLAGALGSVQLPAMARRLGQFLQNGVGPDRSLAPFWAD